MPPKRSVTASRMPGHCSGRPTSAWRPSPPSDSAVRSAAAPSRSTTATDTPAPARMVAVARPIPDPPPVTTATVPARSHGFPRLVIGPVAGPAGQTHDGPDVTLPGTWGILNGCRSRPDRAPLDHETPISMRPIPVAFHVWFLEVHTYGIGLALTFWFGLRYTERRLRRAGYPWQWVTGMFVWVVAAIVGARALHVVSNLSFYSHQPGQILAIWQGGLSSFGGLLFAVPVAILSTRRRCPQLPTLRFADLMAPVLMACWGIGRLLGPQLMVAGGGHPTSQWFGMYYAGQPGKRLPVPLPVHRGLHHLRHPPPGRALAAADSAAPVAAATGEDGAPGATLLPPSGIVLGVGMVLWGLERFFDQHLWLGEDGFISARSSSSGRGSPWPWPGWSCSISRLGPLQRWRRGEGGDPAPQPVGSDGPQALADGQDGPVGEDNEGADLSDRGDDAATPTPVPSHRTIPRGLGQRLSGAPSRAGSQGRGTPPVRVRSLPAEHSAPRVPGRPVRRRARCGPTAPTPTPASTAASASHGQHAAGARAAPAAMARRRRPAPPPSPADRPSGRPRGTGDGRPAARRDRPGPG